jgi:hypothetical protein
MQEKSKSPFYPGQPAPVELFVGRAKEIDRIMVRGVGQIKHGKPQSLFVQGDYGIGKSSIAVYTSALAYKQSNFLRVYVTLGGLRNTIDVANAILEGIVKASSDQPDIKDFLGKYISEINLFGAVKINTKVLAEDAPNISTPASMIDFLGSVYKKINLPNHPIGGIFLILDEINGIAKDPQFAQLIKRLVDVNAASESPIPLLLMLCGIEDRLREMIENHRSVDRVFDIINIDRLSNAEVMEFYKTAFESVKLDNFLRKMKELGAIKNGASRGEYEFTFTLTPAYLRLISRIDGSLMRER